VPALVSEYRLAVASEVAPTDLAPLFVQRRNDPVIAECRIGRLSVDAEVLPSVTCPRSLRDK